MITYLFRVIWVAVRGLSGPPAPLLETATLPIRAWPWDLDINGHLNNGRYLTWMDFGRLYLAARSAWFLPALRRRVQPLVALSALRHFKPIPAFGLARLDSRLVAWDDKWLYFEHRFYYKGELAAVGMVKALLADRRGRPIPSKESLSWTGHRGASPHLPAHFKNWLKSEEGLIRVLKKERDES